MQKLGLGEKDTGTHPGLLTPESLLPLCWAGAWVGAFLKSISEASKIRPGLEPLLQRKLTLGKAKEI